MNDAPTSPPPAGPRPSPRATRPRGADLFSGVTISTIEAGQTITGLTLTISSVTNGASEILRIDGSDVALTNGNSVLTGTETDLTGNVSVDGRDGRPSVRQRRLDDAAGQRTPGRRPRLRQHERRTRRRPDVATITQISRSGGTASGGVDTASPNVAATLTVGGVN